MAMAHSAFVLMVLAASAGPSLAHTKHLTIEQLGRTVAEEEHDIMSQMAKIEAEERELNEREAMLKEHHRNSLYNNHVSAEEESQADSLQSHVHRLKAQAEEAASKAQQAAVQAAKVAELAKTTSDVGVSAAAADLSKRPLVATQMQKRTAVHKDESLVQTEESSKKERAALELSMKTKLVDAIKRAGSDKMNEAEIKSWFTNFDKYDSFLNTEGLDHAQELLTLLKATLMLREGFNQMKVGMTPLEHPIPVSELMEGVKSPEKVGALWKAMAKGSGLIQTAASVSQRSSMKSAITKIDKSLGELDLSMQDTTKDLERAKNGMAQSQTELLAIEKLRETAEKEHRERDRAWAHQESERLVKTANQFREMLETKKSDLAQQLAEKRKMEAQHAVSLIGAAVLDARAALLQSKPDQQDAWKFERAFSSSLIKNLKNHKMSMSEAMAKLDESSSTWPAFIKSVDPKIGTVLVEVLSKRQEVISNDALHADRLGREIFGKL